MTEYDGRPLIKDLLAERSSDIDTVRNEIKSHPLYESSRYDDTWILRFVLSHKKKTDAATRAAIATMEFRQTHKLNDRDLRAKIGNCDGVPRLPVWEKLFVGCDKYAFLNHLPDENRGVIMYIFLAKMDMLRISEAMTQDEMKMSTIYINEVISQILDGITRKTGRLTKLVKVVDFDGMAIGKMNRAYLSKDSAASKEIDDYFPQLLGSMFIVNPPKWINVIWKFVRPLMPKRIVEKVDILPSNRDKVQKRLLEFVSKENLLERFGGENKEWPPQAAGDLFE